MVARKGPMPGEPAAHIKRCTFTRKDGTRCRRPAMKGVNICATPSHGGSLPGVRAKVKKARLAEVLDSRLFRHGYGTRPVDENHVGGNPVTGYLWELRRTAGNIITCEEFIAELDPNEIIWGKTKHESKDAAVSYTVQGDPVDGSYEMTVEEGKLHMWGVIYLQERKHYAGLLKMGIAAGLEVKRMAMQEAMVLQLNGAITNIISNLGQDPHSAAIRAMVREELIALERPDETALDLD